MEISLTWDGILATTGYIFENVYNLSIALSCILNLSFPTAIIESNFPTLKEQLNP